MVVARVVLRAGTLAQILDRNPIKGGQKGVGSLGQDG
jgi:hypothetical protein